ncbi:unnamed protein product [Microthlaspi erraticum]|uniref:F-box domain-containing protein n=1 Tax=Microthlaspi erraticum TaxID=1685480 RepID=A0A6D2I852_9BRAS|nr:unnamed protein product [Microthlaspi erraticum]
MNGGEPPIKRRRMAILMLPDDLLFNCLARVSRLYYPSISLVSKRFRSLLASTELYATRTLLGRTETCLYVCLRLREPYPAKSNQLRWFTLCRRPHSSKKILAPVSSLDSPSAIWSEGEVVGPNIYIIGGLMKGTASSSVMIMDCHSHKWREAPSMRLGRGFHSACALDGKIYVTGGCEDLDPTNWMEVFDTKTQTWEFLQIPSEEICGGAEYKIISYEGTIYVRSKEADATYKLHRGRWRVEDIAMNLGWGSSSAHCVIENVFYRLNNKRSIDWYDSREKVWKPLKGLDIIWPRLIGSGHVKLTDYGGKLVLLWEEYVNRKIWCAEIAIDRRQKGEIWGMLEWFVVVSTTNEPFLLEHALTTTL